MKSAYDNSELWNSDERATLSNIARSLATLAEECNSSGYDAFAVMLKAMSHTMLREENGVAANACNGRPH